MINKPTNKRKTKMENMIDIHQGEITWKSKVKLVWAYIM